MRTNFALTLSGNCPLILAQARHDVIQVTLSMSAALSGLTVDDESVLRRFLRLRRLTLGLADADSDVPSSSLARLELELASQDVSRNRSDI